MSEMFEAGLYGDVYHMGKETAYIATLTGD